MRVRPAWIGVAACAMLVCSATARGEGRRAASEDGTRASASDAAQPRAAAIEAGISPQDGPVVVLDRVVAVVNGDVILESDVQEEMRLASLQPIRASSRRNGPQRALRRLIDRDLIEQQMKARQAHVKEPLPAEVEKQIHELREQLPQCAGHKCDTDSSWRTFLAERGLTPEELRSRWRERMIILSFIQVRFGAGVKISQDDIRDYYEKDFAPEFLKRGVPPPPLEGVSKRIEEVLLQERVNDLLREWLESLKQEGSVRILVPEYGNGNGVAQENSSEGLP